MITKTQITGGRTYVTSYQYNAAGRVTQITYPSGRIVLVARNAMGQVTGVTTKQTAAAAVVNVATGLTWRPQSDLLVGMTHGNGLATTATHDLDYRLTQLQLKDGAALISGYAYAYSDGLNLTGITDQVTAGNSNVLGYSPANRLTAASGAWGTNTFTYDAVGNRLTDVTSLKNRVATYATTSNRLNTLTETRPGENFTCSYKNRNRLIAATRNSVSNDVESAELFAIWKVKGGFDPAAELVGSAYHESVACPVC